MSLSVDSWRSEPVAEPLRLPATGSGFASLMGELQSGARADSAAARPDSYTVASGDTLTGIVQQLAQQRGLTPSPEQRHRLALELAQRNQIANPNRIMPGQTLQLGSLQAELDQIGPASPSVLRTAAATAPATAGAPGAVANATTQAWLARRGQSAAPSPQALALLSPQTQRAIPGARAPFPTAAAPAAGAHPVLQQTLDRAVARGFIPPQERQAVQDRILQLAQKYRFAPDDFARLSLMESDGLNPKASNQRCHGIIQFCDGPNRGAATVGFAQQPKAILGMSVYQQLSLVDTYFQEVGLGKQGPASLDDLYLSVLQPTARQEKQPHMPLPILGPQARDLHVGADTSQAITRQSIVQGLLKNSRDKLNQLLGQGAAPRPAAAQVSQAPNERGTQLR